LILASEVGKSYFEAGAFRHLGDDKLAKSVQKVMLKVERFWTREGSRDVIRHDSNLIIQENYSKMFMKVLINQFSLRKRYKCGRNSNVTWLGEVSRSFVWNGKEVFGSLISGLEVNFLLYEMVVMVTEGGKGILSYNFLVTEGEGVSRYGQGCFMEEILISQEVHDVEGFCRRINLASRVNQDCLDTGAIAHHNGNKLTDGPLEMLNGFKENEVVIGPD
jgi:hypothetical protein